MKRGYWLVLLMGSWATAAELPVVRVASDDVRIDKSCRVEIAPGAVIEDTNGDGVIHVVAPNIVIEFADGAVLRGAAKETRPDEYKGYGIRLDGQANVTIRNAKVSGFWCGLYASKADGLMLEGVDASDNRRAYLRSTPVAEDGADWLFPHNNENNEWLKNYAAAIYIEDSKGITVHDCRVTHGQNALCLDRVTDSRIYDNDFSFNSGWGLALWRSERNIISRNAMDFCVRGYSHGVYNRGQDSAGILAFEQNNGNIIAENSVTHGGDGFFGFAGREAIAETGEHPVEWYKRRGNSENILIGNDFSYAPAHGIEMTFSFGNKFLNNRMVDNAICGIWGGYSQDTLIAGNLFESNGGMGYGLERGGVNIEHGRNNRVVRNMFVRNKCGVHFWGGPNPNFAAKGWGKANGIESTQNVIAGNTFDGDALVMHFRGPGDVLVGQNILRNVGREMLVEGGYEVKQGKVEMEPTGVKLPELPGKKKPVGARPELRGREQIIMTEWGPWDHASPLVRLAKSTGGERVYELHKMPGEIRVNLEGAGVRGNLATEAGKPAKYTVSVAEPGVRSYRLEIASGDYRTTVSETILSARWDATFFKWTKEVDPREKLAEWRKLAEGPEAKRVELGEISLKYGTGGPGDVVDALKNAGLGGDHFGMIAKTRLPMPKGKWSIKTTSDDGVRVLVDGKPVIENWTWHVPTRNSGTFEVAEEGRAVEITVEHFEIDGISTMELELGPGK